MMMMSSRAGNWSQLKVNSPSTGLWLFNSIFFPYHYSRFFFLSLSPFNVDSVDKRKRFSSIFRARHQVLIQRRNAERLRVQDIAQFFDDHFSEKRGPSERRLYVFIIHSKLSLFCVCRWQGRKEKRKEWRDHCRPSIQLWHGGFSLAPAPSQREKKFLLCWTHWRTNARTVQPDVYGNKQMMYLFTHSL